MRWPSPPTPAAHFTIRPRQTRPPPFLVIVRLLSSAQSAPQSRWSNSVWSRPALRHPCRSRPAHPTSPTCPTRPIGGAKASPGRCLFCSSTATSRNPPRSSAVLANLPTHHTLSLASHNLALIQRSVRTISGIRRETLAAGLGGSRHWWCVQWWFFYRRRVGSWVGKRERKRD